mmetsp:Transcript_63116/g.86773  ORF Transcript_63116/g.86773 Transcript_63116/m.86773 type:complete len:174 (-) Transcript_63116:370-891(-)
MANHVPPLDFSRKINIPKLDVPPPSAQQEPPPDSACTPRRWLQSHIDSANKINSDVDNTSLFTVRGRDSARFFDGSNPDEDAPIRQRWGRKVHGKYCFVTAIYYNTKLQLEVLISGSVTKHRLTCTHQDIEIAPTRAAKLEMMKVVADDLEFDMLSGNVMFGAAVPASWISHS